MTLAVGFFAGQAVFETSEQAASETSSDGLAVSVRQNGDLFARIGEINITYSDVHGFMRKEIPENDRAGFLRNPSRIATMINNLTARYGIAERAVSEGLLDQRGIQAEILHKAVNTLFDEYARNYVEAQLLDSYEAQAREAYLLDPNRFPQPRTVTFRHLLVIPEDSGGEVSAMEKIIEITRDLADEQDRFDELIEAYSQDPLLQENGGLYERIDPEMLEPSMASVLREMQPGDISEPIRTRHGWHIVELEAWHAPETPKYEDVREQYIDAARSAHRRELHEQLVEETLSGELFIPEGAVEDLLKRYNADIDLNNADVRGGQ